MHRSSSPQPVGPTSGGASHRWAENRFLPTVLVIATPDVAPILRKAGLRSALDLLRPWHMLQKDVYARTLKEDNAITVKNFGIRLRSPADLRNITEDQRYRYFQHVSNKMSNESVEGLDELLNVICSSSDSQHPALSGTQQTMLRNISTPWFDVFKHEFVHSCRFNYWDTLDHPLGVIYVTTTGTRSPVAQLQALYKEHTEQLFAAYNVDPGLYKMCFMLHDCSAPPPQEVSEEAYSQAKQDFGVMETKLLHINSELQQQSEKPEPTFWKNPTVAIDAYCCEEQHDPPTHIGPVLLSEPEAERVRNTVHEYIERGLVHAMERRIKQLHTSIQGKSKSKFGAKISSMLFGRSEAQEAADNALREGARYAVDSVEFQTRKLGDLLFLLRDYTQAAGYYRNLRSDLSSSGQPPPSTLPYIAACYEALGLCMWFQGRGSTVGSGSGYLSGVGMASGKKDIEASLASAVQYYQQCQRTDYATRVCILHYTLCRMRHAAQRANDVLLRASVVEEKRALYGAWYCEQNALCFLSAANACSHRKFCSFMISAGRKFAGVNANAHAIRCYKLAARVYGRNCWPQIDEHINSVLGALYSLDGPTRDLSLAVRHTLRHLRRSTQPGIKQAAALTDLCALLQNYLTSIGSDCYENCPVPHMTSKEVAIRSNLYGHVGSLPPNLGQQHPTEPADEEVAAAEDAWKTFRTAMLTGKNVHRSYTSNRTTAIVGEAVVVEVNVVNPLRAPVELSNVQLLVNFNPPAQRSPSSDSITSVASLGNIKVESSAPSDATLDTQNAVLCHVVNAITLAPLGKATLVLSFTPQKEGTVELRGVAWTLCGSVRACKWFTEADLSLEESLEQERDPDVLFSPGSLASFSQKQTSQNGTEVPQSLQVEVQPPMPCLNFTTLRQVPALLSGQVHRVDFLLRNIGVSKLGHLSLGYTRPQAITFAPPSVYSAEAPADKAAQEGDVEATALDCRRGFSTIAFQDLAIEPNSTVVLPAFVRAGEPGLHHFFLHLVYADERAGAYRIHRARLSVTVYPSVLLRCFCLPAYPGPSPVPADDDAGAVVTGGSTPTAGGKGVTPLGADCIVTLEMHNARRQNALPYVRNVVAPKVFHVLQVTAVSREWEVTPVRFEDLQPYFANGVLPLYPNQSVLLFFKVSRRGLNRDVVPVPLLRPMGSGLTSIPISKDDLGLRHSCFLTGSPEATSSRFASLSAPTDQQNAQQVTAISTQTTAGIRLDSRTRAHVDTTAWPTSHFVLTSRPRATVSVTNPTQTVTQTVPQPLQLKPASAEVPSHSAPLAFLCSWMCDGEGVEGNAVGHSQVVVLPYLWMRRWTKTEVSDQVAQLTLAQLACGPSAQPEAAVPPAPSSRNAAQSPAGAVPSTPQPPTSGPGGVKSREELRITLRLSYAEHISVSANRGGGAAPAGPGLPVVVPVQLFVTNHSDQPRDVTIILNQHTQGYHWQGKATQRLCGVPPRTEVGADLLVRIERYGMHDLNTFQVLPADTMTPVMDTLLSHLCEVLP